MSQSQPASGPAALAAEDRELVAACVARRAGAWEGFLLRFGGLFAHIVDRAARIRRMPLPPAARDDLVAEIVLECLRKDAAALRGFAGRSSLPTYLAVIARRVAVRHLARDAGNFRTVTTEGTAAPAAPASDLPERIDDREQVETYLGQLEPDEARLVRLHHLEARSYGEISRLTGLPLGSIGPALSRIRGKLRSLMETPRG